MTQPIDADQERRVQQYAMSILTRVTGVVAIAFICYQVMAPFIGIVAWAIILAVALLPAHLALSARLGGRQTLSAVLIVLAGLALLIVPVWSTAESTIDSASRLAGELRSGELTIPPPGDKVREWPFIGEKVYTAWSNASTDIAQTLSNFRPQLSALSGKVLGFVGGLASGVLHFVVSIIIAGVFLVNAEGGYKLSAAIAARVAGPRGQHLTDLSIATVRSVTKGVLGVALFQAILATIGMAVMQVPAAGIVGAVVLVTAIVQIPALLILGPIVFWVYSFADPVPATIFAVYMLLVALSDNILKPMLLGRGVDLPMLVILLGAIGGAISGGVIGLFVGATALAVGYTIMDDWLKHDKAAQHAGDAPQTP